MAQYFSAYRENIPEHFSQDIRRRRLGHNARTFRAKCWIYWKGKI